MKHRTPLFYITKQLGMVFTLMILIMVCFSADALAENATVTAGVANVRSGPGSSYEVAGSIYAGTEVNVIETSGSWHKIKLGNLTGWMSDTVLEVAPGEKQLESLVVTGQTVNLRSGPGTNYEIVGKVTQGDSLGLLGVEGNWYKVKNTDGSTGYISADLVQKANTVGQQVPVFDTQPAPAAAQPATPAATEYIQALSGTVKVRSGPGTTFAEQATIDGSQVYAVTGKDGDWLQIALADGSSGYVASWLVQAAAGQNLSPVPAQPVNTLPGSSLDGTPVVYLNGQQLSFDVAPRIENGRTLVPLRAIFEAVGANVQWDAATSTVKAVRSNTEVILTIGSLNPTVGGQAWTLDVPAKIVNDRTLAPLRFVGEAFGGQVGWDADTRTITITIAPDNARAVAITASNGDVNLRSGPGVNFESKDMVSRGERLSILAEQDGWYQVSRGGRTGWVAGWVVDVVWEEDQPTAEKPISKPEPELESEPEPAKPAKPGEDVVWLSARTDEQGLYIIMESGGELDSNKPVERTSKIEYTFEDKEIEGLYLLKQEFGSSYVNATAVNEKGDLIIEISLPSGAEYETSWSDDGKKAVVTVFNYITAVERKTFAKTGERIIINTALPFDYDSELKDDTIIITMNDVLMGRADSRYRFSSGLINDVRFEPTDRGKSTLVTINADNLGKHVFAASGEKQAFTVLMIEQSEVKISEKNLIVLDPGHGGSDTGARGTEINEKDVNLDIALKAGAILEKNGLKVEYTRTTDKTVGLEERALIANDFNAELFVSIHNNADVAKVGHGTETYFYAPLSTPELYMQIDERKLLAQKLQQQLISKLKRADRGVKEKNLSVLRNATMPSALVEIMFISSTEEQALLKQEKYKDLAAEAIAQGILNYLDAR